MKNIEELRSLLQKNDPVNGVVPFWFLNHYPEETEIRKQIREIAEKGCTGVMLHARDGLLCGYLNAHWEKTVGWAVDEAKKQNISIWLYDELNYPSGPVGGQIFDVCPDTAMQSLELVSITEEKPDGDFDKLIRNDGKYLAFMFRYQRQYPDYLDKNAMKEFVKLSYTWYYERFKEHFGSLIQGEFTDNSCANFGYHRRSIPWTPAMPELFREKTGYELDEILPSLFLQTGNSALHRLIFWRFLNELYLETFIIPIEQECAGNGIAATGHYCIETGVSEHVRQIGDRFDQKRHQHIPGVDMLGADTWEGLASFPIGTPSSMLAMTASPGYFFHNSSVLCECLGLSMKWAMPLAEIKRITGTLAALGINIFVPHGLYYSISGHRKRECIPDFYHNTMWEYFGDWAKWIRTLGTLTAKADEHLADTVLLYPATSQQASIEVGTGAPYVDQGERCIKQDKLWTATGDILVQNAIPFEIINEDILCNGNVCNGELQITLPNGNIHKIHSIVLVSSWIIGDKTYDKLQEFAKSGGCIIAEGEQLSAVFTGKEILPVTPEKEFYTAIYDVEDKAGLEQTDLPVLLAKKQQVTRVIITGGQNSIVKKEWIKDGHYFALLQNFTRNKIGKVEIRCDFQPVTVDLDSMQFFRAKDSVLVKDFEYGEVLLLTDCEGELPELPDVQPIPENRLNIAPSAWEINMEQPNALCFPETQFRNNHGNNTRQFSWEFEIDTLPEKLGVALDLEPLLMEMRNGYNPFTLRYHNMLYNSRCQAYINGNLLDNIQFGKDFDRWIYEGDITKFIKPGKNTVVLEQPNELLEQNRTFPEPLLLTGSFAVRDDGVITAAPGTLPDLTWHNSALKHYSGTMRFSAKIQLPENMRQKELHLICHDVREIVEVIINGTSCGHRFMPPYTFTIPENLTGTDALELTLRVSNTPANRWQEPIPSGILGGIELY